MKKIFKNMNFICATSILVSAPIALATSCGQGQPHENIPIESLKLSSRPSYICPGEKLKIDKNTTPTEGMHNDTIWEIVECPFEGFTISNDGILSAPENLEISQPVSIKIKATDVLNPQVFDTISIQIINKPNPDQPFIGFVDNKVNYYGRDGQETSVGIVKTGDYQYKIEKPIDMFIGHSKTDIDFSPLILKGCNTRMRFHLHDEQQPTLALAWVGYSDNTWTDTIPTLRVGYVQQRHDVMDVTFACDERVHLKLNFNVWQEEIQETDGIISYYSNDDSDYHNIKEVDSGMYNCYINLDSKVTKESWTEMDVLDGIYVYRKPYQYLDDLNFIIKYPTSGDLIPQEDTEISIVNPTRMIIWPYNQYEGYRLGLTCKFRNFDAEAFNYDQILLFTLQVWNPRSTLTPLCYCNFYAHWKD